MQRKDNRLKKKKIRKRGKYSRKNRQYPRLKDQKFSILKEPQSSLNNKLKNPH